MKKELPPMFNRLLVPCLLASLFVGPTTSKAAEPNRNIIRRGSYTNSQIKFEREQKGHVAFIGGSITEMNGYRPLVCEDLQKRYPDTEFTFTAAGISSTCSTTGAFRLGRDVLSKGPVDLFFIEFAVNDDQDAGHARRECIRGMEGIIRQCRSHNPNMDIVVTFFVNPGMLEMLQHDKTPVSMESHSAVLVGQRQLFQRALPGIGDSLHRQRLRLESSHARLEEHSWRQTSTLHKHPASLRD
jgi:hypothetical protein